jgi:hypothetical protein
MQVKPKVFHAVLAVVGPPQSQTALKTPTTLMAIFTHEHISRLGLKQLSLDHIMTLRGAIVRRGPGSLLGS